MIKRWRKYDSDPPIYGDNFIWVANKDKSIIAKAQLIEYYFDNTYSVPSHSKLHQEGVEWWRPIKVSNKSIIKTLEARIALNDVDRRETNTTKT